MFVCTANVAVTLTRPFVVQLIGSYLVRAKSLGEGRNQRIWLPLIITLRLRFVFNVGRGDKHGRFELVLEVVRADFILQERALIAVVKFQWGW